MKDNPLIHLNKVTKSYKTEAGDFLALNDVSLQVEKGEFVAVIGKSGSGKSTLVNMITGIDRPTFGDIRVADTDLVGMDENRMAQWRGRNLGIVFQFFQLLPNLTVLENVMIPMDFCNIYEPKKREVKALSFLEMVEIGKEQSHKLPSQLSGGQQQRVAIARALSNNPKIIAADEPTGNLDSKTASLIFDLFVRLVDEGKTIMMVTHDRDLARKVQRTLIISDGEIIEEYLTQTFKGLNEKQLAWITSRLKRKKVSEGEVILKRGEPVDTLYIVTKGMVEVVIEPSSGRQFIAAQLSKGKFFGEIELMRGGGNSLATVRATLDGPAEVVAIDKNTFERLIKDASSVREQLGKAAKKHYQEHLAHKKK
jgi:ABC-type lipoprotein export system ATPase subunit